MFIYSDKLAHIQVVINSRYSIAQMYTCEDTLAHSLGAPYIDDVMSYNSLTTFDILYGAASWAEISQPQWRGKNESKN